MTITTLWVISVEFIPAGLRLEIFECEHWIEKHGIDDT